jgi:hypothetical protein
MARTTPASKKILREKLANARTGPEQKARNKELKRRFERTQTKAR